MRGTFYTHASKILPSFEEITKEKVNIKGYLEGLDVHVSNGGGVHHGLPPFCLLVRDDDPHPLRGQAHIFPMLRVKPCVDTMFKVQRF